MALLGWSIGVTAMVLISAAFWPTIREQGEEFRQLIDRMPAVFKTLIDVDDFTSPAGYLKARLFGLVLPMLLLIYAIGRGADLIAGEEERGSLDVLLTHPISRRRILLEKAGALAVGVAVLGAVAFVALVVGAIAWDIPIGIAQLAGATALVVLLAGSLGALALALGAWRGRKALAVAGTTGIAVLSWVLDSLAGLVEWLGRLWPISPFALYGRSDPLVGEVDAASILILAGATVALVALAAWAFDRRDVGV